MSSFPGSQSPGAAFADICKTPAPAGPTPVPYPNVSSSKSGAMATDWETTNAVNRTKLQTKHGVSASKASAFTSTKGDETGTASLKGVMSSKTQGKMQMSSYSSNVKAEGKQVVRFLSSTMNKH
jgi:hypothetical protein